MVARVKPIVQREPNDVDARSTSITDSIYEALWNEIVFGNAEPGVSLDELALVARFSSSRTPIREALARLTGDGLVVQHRNRGAYIADVRVQEFPAFFEALHLSQRVVTKLAALRRSETELAAIGRSAEEYEARVENMNHRELVQLDQAFHLAIAGASKNPHFEALYRRLLAQQARILLLHSREGRYAAEFSEQARVTASEHAELVRAISMRDAEFADQLAGDHLRLTRKRVAMLTAGEITFVT